MTLNAPDIVFNIQVGNNNILPGTSDTLIVTLVNQGHAPLNPDRLQVSSPTSLLAFGVCASDTGNVNPSEGIILNSQFSILNSLLPGVTARFSFPLHADSLLPLGIKVPITLTLTQLSINTTYPLYIGANPLETFEGGVYHTSGWTQGYYPWTINMYGAYAGIYCLRSASSLGNSQTSEISIPVSLTAPDSVRFYYRVSSEANYDKFHFYIDNSDLLAESGIVAWTRAAFLVPAGSHTLRFTYAKDGSVYSNEDCAWIDNVTLPHQSRPVHFQSDTLCAGSLYIVAGDTINTSQSGSYTIVDNTASDSVLLVDYTVYPTYSIVDSLVACDSINWNGHTYYSSTSLDQYTASSSHGCDSVISLHLTVHPSYTADETISACDSLWWNNALYTASTDLTEQLTTAYGCDSTMHYHLVVHYSVRDTVCDSTSANSYTWNDSTYHLSGTYIQHFSTVQGCDSTVVLVLKLGNGGTQSILSPASPNPITVYPNPTNGRFTINADGLLSVDVIDNAGRVVATFSDTNQFDLSRMPTGNYLLRIKLQSGFVTCRIVKQ